MNFGLILNYALAVRADGTYVPFSAEAWSYAGQMTLLGIGMVFSVLAILMLVLMIFKLVFAGPTKKAKTPKAKQEKTVAPKTETVVEPLSVTKVHADRGIPANNDDEALIAVITAAVAAYRASENISEGFRVVSFRRAGNRHWNSK